MNLIQNGDYKIIYKLANEEDFMGNLNELNGYKDIINLLGNDYTYIRTATDIQPYSEWGGEVEIFQSANNDREVKFIQSIDEQDNIIENYYIFVGVVGDNDGSEFDLLAEALILPKTNINENELISEKNKITNRNMTLWKFAINNMNLADIKSIKKLELKPEIIVALEIREKYLENNEEKGEIINVNRSNLFKRKFKDLCNNATTCFLKKHKGGKRRRQRSNKKRTNKRKKTKTRMKKRKTSKRKTNKRRRKR